jgi:hypothetical protein
LGWMNMDFSLFSTPPCSGRVRTCSERSPSTHESLESI